MAQKEADPGEWNPTQLTAHRHRTDVTLWLIPETDLPGIEQAPTGRLILSFSGIAVG